MTQIFLTDSCAFADVKAQGTVIFTKKIISESSFRTILHNLFDSALLKLTITFFVLSITVLNRCLFSRADVKELKI